MTGELKRAMALIKGNKQYKAAFGLHPVFIGLYVFCGVMSDSVAVIERLIEKSIGDVESLAAYSLMTGICYLFFGSMFGTQQEAIKYSGKGMLSVPFAKSALTKGIILSRLMSLCVCFMTATVVRIVCVATGVCEKSRFATLFLSLGAAYLLLTLLGEYKWFNRIAPFSILLLGWSETIANKLFDASMTDVIEFLDNGMPWWMVAAIFVAMVVCGTVFGVKVLEHTYKKRMVTYDKLLLKPFWK